MEMVWLLIDRAGVIRAFPDCDTALLTVDPCGADPKFLREAGMTLWAVEVEKRVDWLIS